MIFKIIKLITVVSYIFLLSGCAEMYGTALVAAGVIGVTDVADHAKNERSVYWEWGVFGGWKFDHTIDGHDSFPFVAYGKDFTSQYNQSDVKNNSITNTNTTCSNIKVSTIRFSTFSMEHWNISSDTVNLTLLNNSQIVNNDIPILLYSKIVIRYYNTNGNPKTYRLGDAIDYQWCKGYNNFIDKHRQVQNNYAKIDNMSLIYKVNLELLTNTSKCSKWFGEGHCINFNYNYSINIIDNKTNTTIFSKKLEYTDNSSYTTGDIAYNTLGYYVLSILRKNREVIEREVFTDELYKTLSNASQNPTTY